MFTTLMIVAALQASPTAVAVQPQRNFERGPVAESSEDQRTPPDSRRTPRRGPSAEREVGPDQGVAPEGPRGPRTEGLRGPRRGAAEDDGRSRDRIERPRGPRAERGIAPEREGRRGPDARGERRRGEGQFEGRRQFRRHLQGIMRTPEGRRMMERFIERRRQAGAERDDRFEGRRGMERDGRPSPRREGTPDARERPERGGPGGEAREGRSNERRPAERGSRRDRDMTDDAPARRARPGIERRPERPADGESRPE